ncbi:hypothetical protein TNCV_722591 [Trichonephila clavipes]|nr:hypothetical protein TNCV_722591 [Trichonephila clavipes]
MRVWIEHPEGWLSISCREYIALPLLSMAVVGCTRGMKTCTRRVRFVRDQERVKIVTKGSFVHLAERNS